MLRNSQRGTLGDDSHDRDTVDVLEIAGFPYALIDSDSAGMPRPESQEQAENSTKQRIASHPGGRRRGRPPPVLKPDVAHLELSENLQRAGAVQEVRSLQAPPLCRSECLVLEVQSAERLCVVARVRDLTVSDHL